MRFAQSAPSMYILLKKFSIINIQIDRTLRIKQCCEHESYTALPRQKDISDIAPSSLFQLYYLHTKHELNDTPNELWQTQAEDDNSFVWLTFNAGHLYWTFNLLCNHTLCKWYSWNRHKGSLRSFCRGTAV